MFERIGQLELIGTTTNYVNGGFSIELPIRDLGVDLQESGWYKELLAEGFRKSYVFREEQMTGDYGLWVMTRELVTDRMGRNYMNQPAVVQDVTVLEYAIVAYRDGSPDPQMNSKVLLGEKYSPEEYKQELWGSVSSE
jgi:hypothetical protein